MQADELKGLDLSDLDELEKERLAMGQKAFKMIVYGFLGIIVVSGFLASLHLGNLFFFFANRRSFLSWQDDKWAKKRAYNKI
ncbi:hypothetical protein [Campylobacter concisus]|uniref:hypothetical protein n=1 Tax=Campylobacter concisus TaxID=199 RepID=UPI0015E18426|nr:hypothetical protein [Campylobacter concisus]